MSEQISTISLEPFINEFIAAIIKNIKAKKLSQERKTILHADLVPRFSNQIIQASLMEKRTLPRKELEIELATPVKQPRILQTPKPMPLPKRKIILRRPMAPPIQRPPIQQAPPTIPQATTTKTPAQNYGKIEPLLNDPSVSSIECQGVGKPIMIIRAGQRQITKITLSMDEIKNILDKISEETHIPLLEGVFRAALKAFSISAVISEIIGSRFVIKKNNAYAMLERHP